MGVVVASALWFIAAAATAEPRKPTHVACVGDSITQGSGEPSNDQQHLKDYRAMADHFLGLPSKPVVYAALPLATGNNPCCSIRGSVIRDQQIP